MRPRRALAAPALLLIALVLTSCWRDDGTAGTSDGSGRSVDSTAAPTATTTVPPVDLVFVGVEPNGTAPPSDAVLAQVQATLRGWFASAILAPLRSGGPAPDLSPFFTPVALERVSGPDRPTMVEEGLPAASRSVTGEVTNVVLGSVAGPDEVTAVVVARMDLRLHAVGPGLDVDIGRQGDVVLVDAGDTWRIDGFHMRTTRDSRP